MDGASEVHEMVLAEAYRTEGDAFWSWGVPEAGPGMRKAS